MYFSNCTTVNEVKKEYRKLCFIHHPDIGGDTATMQEVNRQYHEALSRFDGRTAKGTDGKDHTYYYKQDVEQAVMDKIDELIQLNLAGVDIWLIGTWVWVDGDTRPVKDQLKDAGLKWHSKRKKWYWHNGSKYRRYNKRASFTDLAATYGASHFKSDEESKPRGQAVALPA